MGTVTNPLSGLIEGLLQGHNLGLQIRNQQMQEQAFKTRQAMDQRQMSVQDIMDRQMLEQNARPVDNGTVTAPGTLDTASSSYAVPGALPGLPDTQASVPGYGNVVRKADPSRTVAYKDSQGNQRQYELLTPQEQARGQATREATIKHAGMTPIQTPDHLKALGLPNQVWVPDEHLAQYAEATSQTRPIQTPQSMQDIGYPATITARQLPTLMTQVGAGQRTTERIEGKHEDVQTQQEGANHRTGEVITSKKDIVQTQEQGKDKRTGEIVQGHKDVAAIRDAGVGNRFDARQAAQTQKQMGILQGKEADLQAARVQLNSNLTNPNLNDMQKQVMQGQLKTTAFQLQATRRAKPRWWERRRRPKPSWTKSRKVPRGPARTATPG